MKEGKNSLKTILVQRKIADRKISDRKKSEIRIADGKIVGRKNESGIKEIINRWKLVVNNFMDIICPMTCPMCDKILDKNEKICTVCDKKLVYIFEPKCKKCGKELENERLEYCIDCSVKKHYFKTGIAAFKYDSMVSKSIYKFKYHNRRTYALFYGDAISKVYGSEIRRWSCDVIIPVPIHNKRRIKRGYNQAELIARELSVKLGIPMDAKYMFRVGNTRPMKELDKTARKKNVEKAFKIYKNVVKYKKIILVDDIYTTGSTLDACAKTLLEAGATEIYFVSLSVGQGI